MIKLKLLIESRISQFETDYPTLPDAVKARIIKNDPSSNYKYIDWMGRILSTDPDAPLELVVKDVYDFNRHMMGDIYKYKTFRELHHALETRQKSKNEQTKEGAKVLIDDDNFLVVAPTTRESCGYYGNNTRWCIVNQDKFWNQHYYSGTIIIVLNRKEGEKYAVVGAEGYFEVYDRNDCKCDYSSFCRDDEGSWPEYVQQAISDYAERDNVDKRKDAKISELVDEYIRYNTIDKVWKNYLDAVHHENKITEPISLDLFKSVANENGISNDDLTEAATSYLYDQMYEDWENEDKLGDIDHVEQLDRSICDRGESISDKIEFVVGEYTRRLSGLDVPLNMIKTLVGPREYEKLYTNGTIDEDLMDAVLKYNNMLNSNTQQTFNGMETKKQSVQIRNINDIIYIFKKTGHENLAYYLEAKIRIQESLLRNLMPI